VARSRKDPRHRAREASLQILYQWDLARRDIVKTAGTFFDLQWPNADPPADDLRQFATALARDTTERWRPERMAILDRLILRMASCEMLRDPATPPVVVINEALELARTFTTEESVKFINGMPDAIRKKIEPRTQRMTKDSAA
jgi:N utilization substance protein B